MKQKRWEVVPPNPNLATKLSRELSIHPLVAQILINRGYDQIETAHRFLNPSLEFLENPFQLKDMKLAVSRLEQALQHQESITVYGDYDVDGTTGSTLLYLFLKSLGAKVDVYIPHRVQEGYGLNFQALERLKAQGSELVVTVDNGISSLAEAERAREIGLDLIIIDHHQVPPKIPFACAVLNPKQEDCPYPFKELAGVGVAFQLAMALRNYLREKGFFQNRAEPNLKQYLDLVALGTIADMVPLTGQNRILVKLGLEVLSTSQNPGIIALKEVAGVSGKITPGQVGFRLGPRINAAGRLESAQMGFEMLRADNLEVARVFAKKLDEANQERQLVEAKILEEACTQIESQQWQNAHSLFVYHPDWHVGVVGIVASRLVERYYLPSIVGSLQEGKIRASARSISKLNLYETLSACSAQLMKFGGHQQAAGLTLNLDEAESFRLNFDRSVSSRLKKEDFVPRLKVDVKCDLKEIDELLLEDLDRLEPYGQGNPEPVFLSETLNIVSQQRVGEHHLKLSFRTGQRYIDAIGFKMAHVPLSSQSPSCVFTCQWNEWQGRRKIQLKLSDFPRASSY